MRHTPTSRHTFSRKRDLKKTGPFSFYLPDPSWAKWPYGPWDHFMVSSKNLPGPRILPSEFSCLKAHPIFKFTTYWINSPCVRSGFSFCKIKILLLQNQDSPFVEYKLLATLGAPAGAFFPAKKAFLAFCDMSLFGKVCISVFLSHSGTQPSIFTSF